MERVGQKARRWVALLVAVNFVITPVFAVEASARAAGKQNAEVQKKSKELLKAYLENVKTKDHVLFIVAKNGASSETLETINKDLSKRVPDGTAVPKLSIEDDELTVNGKTTGVKILSYAPIKIQAKNQKRAWSGNASKSNDDNYFDLIKYLEKSQVSDNASANIPMLKLFFPPANALFETAGKGLMWGAIFGLFAGGLLGWFIGGTSMALMMGLGLAGVGAMVGYTYGKSNEMNPPELKAQEWRGTSSQQAAPGVR